MRRVVTSAAAVLALLVALLGGPPSSAGTDPGRAVRSADQTVTAGVALPTRAEALSAARSAVESYYAGSGGATSGDSWQWTPFFMGVLALARETGDPTYRAWLQSWGDRNQWDASAPESPTSNPDSRAAIQVWEASPQVGVTPQLAPSDRLMAADLALSPSRYWWIDALFMGLPLWPTWTGRTGDPAYQAKAGAFYDYLKQDGRSAFRTGCTATGLFDPVEDLWWRDCMYVPRRDALGHKVFWSRGNGWLIAALARMLDATGPADPRHHEYQAMVQRMAARLVELQGSDGMWRSSLLSPSLHPQPETSGTALITTALAHGIRTGVLDRETYLPAVGAAWQGLRTIALQDSGFVSGCQGVGEAPGTPSTTVATPFCVGAFALAAVEIARLDGLVAADSFGRSVTGGWGAAEVGGAWRVTGSAASYSLAGGQARVATPAGTGRAAYLRGVAATDTDLTATLSVPRPTTGSVCASVVGRQVGSSDYRARTVVSADGTVRLQLRRTDGTGLASTTVPGLTVASGDRLRVRLQVVGASPTLLRAKVWKLGATVPAGWQLDLTDSSAGLQQPGTVGLASYLSAGAAPSSATVGFDDLQVVPSGTFLARDTFTRTAVSGWGDAPVGGAWTVTGPSGDSAVGGGTARLTATSGSPRTAVLHGVSSSRTDLRITVGASRPASGSINVSVVGRRVRAGDYRATLTIGPLGDVVLRLRRGSTTLATGTRLTLAAGERLVVRLVVTGTQPTTLRARVWKLGQAEPTGWVGATDATSGLQGPGSLGLYVYGDTAPSPFTVTFDDLTATPAP